MERMMRSTMMDQAAVVERGPAVMNGAAVGTPFVTAVRERGRFGREISVNPVPRAVCSHACRHCPCGPTERLTVDRAEFFPLPAVLAAVDAWAGVHGAPDGVWFDCGGEPSLYARLGELTCCLRHRMPNVRIGVRSNGSLLGDAAVRRELGLCNAVRVSLNACIDDDYRRIDRPHRAVSLEQVLIGLRLLRKAYCGMLEVDTLFVRGVNDTEVNLTGLVGLVLDVRPDRYVISTGGRAGDRGLLPVAAGYLETAARLLEAAPFPVTFDTP
jgi:wyosine [tRNA(Phe)-imidazoG37] synthetase (radical SAM superfamily)